ncbi:hypothetical protein LTS08_004523 [Lithohypha guttulata]|nr:hypothetical protein LTS08_004523 [Lithohypha guttulata]
MAIHCAKLIAAACLGFWAASTTAAPTITSVQIEEEYQPLPFFLNAYNSKRRTFAPEYLTSSGSVQPTYETASPFVLTSYGGLSTLSTEDSFANLYLSTDSSTMSMPWSMSLSLNTIYAGFSFEDTQRGQVLVWKDASFDGGQAKFCQGAGIQIWFYGKMPANCELVDLVAVHPR